MTDQNGDSGSTQEDLGMPHCDHCQANNEELRGWLEALEAWASHVLSVVKDRRIPSAEVIEEGEAIIAHARKAYTVD